MPSRSSGSNNISWALAAVAFTAGCLAPPPAGTSNSGDGGIEFDSAVPDSSQDMSETGGTEADGSRPTDLTPAHDDTNSGGDDVLGSRDAREGDSDADAAPTVVRWKLTIPAEKIDAALTEFVVLVEHTDPAIAALADGRSNFSFLADDETLLSHEFEIVQPANGYLRGWVRLPVVSADTDTNFFLEVDPDGQNSGDASATWEGWAGVWHLHGRHDVGDSSTDSSPNGNDGVVENVENNVVIPGKIGQAVTFDGVDDLIRIPDHPTLKPTAEITLVAWARVTELYGSFISRPATTVSTPFNNSYQLWHSAEGDLIGTLTSTAEATSLSAPGIGTGVWHHTVMTYDGGGMRTYLDGVEVLDEPLAIEIAYDAHDVYLGVDINRDGQSNAEFVHMPLRGDLDEARIRPSAVSAARVAAWYANQNDPATFVNWTLESAD